MVILKQSEQQHWSAHKASTRAASHVIPTQETAVGTK